MQKHRVNFICIQSVACLLLFGLANITSPVEFGVTAGIWVIISYSMMAFYELRASKSVEPVLIYLSHQIVTFGAACLYNSLLIHKNFPLVLSSAPIDSKFLANGILIMLAGDTILFATYMIGMEKFGQGNKLLPDAKQTAKYQLSGILIFYAITLLLRPLIPFLGGAGKLFVLFIDMGGFASLMLLIPWMTSGDLIARGRAYCFAVCLTGIEVFANIGNTSKKSILIVFVPWAILLLLKRRKRSYSPLSLKAALITFLALYFVMFLFFPFFQMRRSLAISGSGLDSPAENDNLSLVAQAAIPSSAAFHEVHQLPAKGFWHFFSRNQKLKETVISYQFFQEGNAELFSFMRKDALVAVVPRILWKNKPDIVTGAGVTAVLWGRDPEGRYNETSHTGLGLYGPLLLIGGWWTLVLGSALNGVIVAFIWCKIRRHIYGNIVAVFIYYELILLGVVLFSSYDGNFGKYLYQFLVLLPLFFCLQKLQMHWAVSRPVLKRFRSRKQQLPIKRRI